MSMKNARWLVALLSCGLVALLIVLVWERLRETRPAKVATERKVPPKPANQNSMSPRSNAAVAAAWEKVSQRKSQPSWVPSDAEGTRKLLFEGIVDDKLKSLNLSRTEAARLVSDFELLDNLRIELEAPMVQVMSFENGVLKLRIPAYPEEGQDIRDMLQATLAQDFSMDQAEKIMELSGNSLGLMFRGFGTMDQTYVVTSLGTEDKSLKVDWRLSLAQRPSKEALVAGVWGGSAGTTEYPLKSFDGGSFASLRPVLQQHFGGGTN